MKKIRLIIFISFIILALLPLAAMKYAHNSALSGDHPNAEHCFDVLPSADQCVYLEKPLPHFLGRRLNIWTGHGDREGYAFQTHTLAPDIKGYAGPINTIIGVNSKGRITKVKIIEHAESETYVSGYLEEFLFQFNGKSINDPFELRNDIDGITQATVTSQAIVQSINKSLKKAAAFPYFFENKDIKPKSYLLHPLFIGFLILTFIFIRSLIVRGISPRPSDLFLFYAFIILYVILFTRFSSNILNFLQLNKTFYSEHLNQLVSTEQPKNRSRNNERIKDQLLEKGLKPYPAKYWKELP